ncbi:MAG: tRNA-binding protein [Fidelibacterota bacterium]
MITLKQFKKVNIRIGTIIQARIFPDADIRAYQLKIDFGGFGLRQSIAQITDRYSVEELLNKQVVAVLNFPPKKIASFTSEVLVLGVNGKNGGIALLELDKPIQNGAKIT